jgi:hypothetical protein
MVDLNVTILEGHDTAVEPSNENKLEVEPEKVETYPCEKCEKVFPKLGRKSLHMRKAHNINTLQYTPAPGNRKVGRPPYRFTCDLCKEKKKTEKELTSHMTLKHGPPKRSLAEMRQGLVQRTASDKMSPPNKKTKEGLKEEHTTRVINAKDLEIKSLERNNFNLSDAVVKKQEQLKNKLT